MRIALSVLLLVSAAAWGQKPHTHKAHVHGAASLDLAVDGSTVTAIFESPAEAIMGFEHDARTPAEVRKRDEALAKLKARFGEMVALPAAAQCAWTAGKTDVRISGSHADVKGEFTAACKGALDRGEIAFAFSKVFPEIHELKVQLIGAGRQTGAVIKHGKGTVKLGK